MQKQTRTEENMDINENSLLQNAEEDVSSYVKNPSFEIKNTLTQEKDMFEELDTPFAEHRIKSFNMRFGRAGMSMSLKDKSEVIICIDVELFGAPGMDNVLATDFVRFYGMLNILPTSWKSEVIVSRQEHCRRFFVSYSTDFLTAILCLDSDFYEFLGLNHYDCDEEPFTV